MRNFKTVMLYTIKEQASKKSFLIVNAIMIALVILMMNVPNLMNSFSGDEPSKILIVDESNIFEGSLTTLNEMNLDYEFEFENNVNLDEVNEKVSQAEYEAAIILQKNEDMIHFDYITNNITESLQGETFKEIFSQIYFYASVEKLNLTEKELASLTTEVSYELKTPSGEEEPEFSASIILLSIGLFFAIYFYAFQVSSTITTEKTSKVMETLVTSTNPKSIILGKTIGMALLGMAQFLVIILVGVVSYKLWMPVDNPLSWLDFSNITSSALVISFIYFILGYTLFAFMYALVGSTVSKPEDIPTANAPVAFISLFGFYFGYFPVILSPTSGLTKIASLLPISSPFSMPFRRMLVNVPMSEIVISMLILLATIIIVIYVSIRVYSMAVLHYGSKLTFKDLFSFTFEK